MVKYTIQRFRCATYHTCVFNIAYVGACDCNRIQAHPGLMLFLLNIDNANSCKLSVKQLVLNITNELNQIFIFFFSRFLVVLFLII